MQLSYQRNQPLLYKAERAEYCTQSTGIEGWEVIEDFWQAVPLLQPTGQDKGRGEKGSTRRQRFGGRKGLPSAPWSQTNRAASLPSSLPSLLHLAWPSVHHSATAWASSASLLAIYQPSPMPLTTWAALCFLASARLLLWRWQCTGAGCGRHHLQWRLPPSLPPWGSLLTPARVVTRAPQRRRLSSSCRPPCNLPTVGGPSPPPPAACGRGLAALHLHAGAIPAYLRSWGAQLAVPARSIRECVVKCIYFMWGGTPAMTTESFQFLLFPIARRRNGPVLRSTECLLERNSTNLPLWEIFF